MTTSEVRNSVCVMEQLRGRGGEIEHTTLRFGCREND
jgi:hypothetical protein